jgi:hypothetical protein
MSLSKTSPEEGHGPFARLPPLSDDGPTIPPVETVLETAAPVPPPLCPDVPLVVSSPVEDWEEPDEVEGAE